MSFATPPKDNKKDAREVAKKDQDQVNKSGVWDNLNNLVLSDKVTYDELCEEHRAQRTYTRKTKGGDALAASEYA
ncbi:unnamed protein product [Nyctereutes procyonoides]|uniref:(raccoon dog) hypothetical protein n=1 Tax=Nyctereutes procyonoides TaxID=34880 RepID=A0A811YT88_NYCPR|nr:unnamed protein product [Nyctereutes procyonoides]